MKIREYSGPLTILAAGVFGFSLICIVSAAALANPGTAPASDLGAQEIVNAGFSNPISTMAAMTAVEISENMPTPTPAFTKTIPPSPTQITYITPTRPFVTWTPVPPTRTRERGRSATSTPIPSRTPSKIPSRTPTSTPVPPTDTRVPTLTSQPTETDTAIPPTETDTPVPPTETNTPEPPPTDTPIVIDTPTSDGIILPQN